MSFTSHLINFTTSGTAQSTLRLNKDRIWPYYVGTVVSTLECCFLISEDNHQPTRFLSLTIRENDGKESNMWVLMQPKDTISAKDRISRTKDPHSDHKSARARGLPMKIRLKQQLHHYNCQFALRITARKFLTTPNHNTSNLVSYTTRRGQVIAWEKKPTSNSQKHDLVLPSW